MNKSFDTKLIFACLAILIAGRVLTGEITENLPSKLLENRETSIIESTIEKKERVLVDKNAKSQGHSKQDAELKEI